MTARARIVGVTDTADRARSSRRHGDGTEGGGHRGGKEAAATHWPKELRKQTNTPTHTQEVVFRVCFFFFLFVVVVVFLLFSFSPTRS
jgi:hypothetical protein